LTQAALLERDLKEKVDAEIRFSNGDRALYATDSSNYRHVPIGVVVPRNVEAIAETVRVCRDHGAPVLNRGGGTSLAGQTANVAVVIDSSKYCNRILSIDPDTRIAEIEPGCVLDHLQKAARPHGLRFGPDPSTHSRCTLGGMIGNNSCGVHSLTWGRTVDNVAELDIVTADGETMTVGCHDDEDYRRIVSEGGRKAEIYRALRTLAEENAERIRSTYPEIPRRVSGFNLDNLLPENGFHVARSLVGTEGTCATILRARVHLHPDPSHRVLVVAGFGSVCEAADIVADIARWQPLGCEGMDQRLVDFMHRKNLHTEELSLLPEGHGWLFIPFGADTAEAARDRADEFAAWLKDQPGVTASEIYEDAASQAGIWRAREAGIGASAFVPGNERDIWPGWEDAAVAPERLGDYMRALIGLCEDFGYTPVLYGHFGEGLIHSRIDFGLSTDEEVRRFRAFMEAAAEQVVSFGGTLSGEHGDGQARGELLEVMYGPELMRAFHDYKRAWDPDNRMNPGKVLDPRPLDEDLRVGPRFKPPGDAELGLNFAYRGTESSFVREAMRCVGVGKCRQTEGGTMCPSYRGTGEEMHSTRGRARLLQEMLQGDPIDDRWNAAKVHEALELCLACKACKKDCPVDVDMATYKAEFNAHYYGHRARPRSHWTLNRIHEWARIGSRAPALANALTGAPGITALAKKVAGVHPDRELPRLADETFRHGWKPATQNRTGPRVVLWPDTFNDHFTPGALFAAAQLLEGAGCAVELPRADVCCGRPLYDVGFIDKARDELRRTMETLREPMEAGAWLVGVEPSCLAVFRDELPNLFPDDPLAALLCERNRTLGSFLTEEVDWQAPDIGGAVSLHGHCSEKALFGMEGEARMLRAAGADVSVTDLGCCGMAGAFGFEEDKYDLSLRIAGQQFMPEVNRCRREGVIFSTSGFSCREQVRQLTGRTVMTPAELLTSALVDLD
jgi:FAD/FMN-containing dehydrogenase/Fe-S oxidoreductase